MTLQELADREALRELVAAYCRAIDRQDLALLRQLYHPDAYDDHGELFRGPRDAYIAWLEKSLGDMASHHFIGNFLLTVTGDTGEGEVYSINTHVLPGTPVREYIAGGRYLDEYIRVDGTWLFMRRERVIDWSHERVAAPGGPSDKIHAGANGPDDRSFAALLSFRRCSLHVEPTSRNQRWQGGVRLSSKAASGENGIARGMRDAGPEAGERFTRQHLLLIFMLAGVAMFEGFDISVTSVVLPYLGREFRVGTEPIGQSLAIIALGSIAAWLLLRLADRFGRRPLLIGTAISFSLGSLATTLAVDLHAYTLIQFLTRMCLVTQMAMAYLILSETLPSNLRGRANGLLGASGSFGAALPLLAIGPALDSLLGWRMLFVIGATPLLLMPLILWKLKETPVWLAARAENAPAATIGEELRRLIAPDLRRRFAGMSLLWIIVNFTTAASSLFFTLYVVNERHWPATDLGRIAPFGLVGAFIGYVGAGALSDLIGRRATLCLSMGLLGGLTTICYTTTNWYLIAAAYIGLQSTMGVWVVAYTINNELFPTDLRGAANGWCHNMIGKWGVVAAPIVLGWLTTSLGSVSAAATMLGGLAWLSIPVILLLIPETRGLRLDRPSSATETLEPASTRTA